MKRTLAIWVCLLLVACVSLAQRGPWRAKARAFQRELNHQYADPKESPLDSIDRIHFKRHQFYPLRARYCVEALLIPTPAASPFEMPTVSGKTKTFVSVCALVFELHGRKDTLYAYRNLALASNDAYKDYLFIPFRDHSSGFRSYGGGRYIDWRMPEDSLQTSHQVYLDLNQCYNPYCAYSTGWNCPIPPQENYVDSKVHAGIRRWKHGH